MEIRNILSLITYVPAAAAIVVLVLPKRSAALIRAAALLGSLATFVLSLHLVVHFDAARARMQFEESVPWIQASAYRVAHHLGIDGISLFLVLLTTVITPLAILASWRAVEDRLRAYMACLLVLETGMIGVFCALDLMLFYVFWEVMLVPMYFLIGIWGGERRIYAAVKFILYTMAGSILMLLAILYLFYANGASSFDLAEITRNLSSGAVKLGPTAEMWLFLAFLIAFAIKVPMFPLHTWLPDAHVEAPTAGSVVLAGVLLKMGTYGILRFCLPLFPGAAREAAPWIAVLALIGIVYGALVAMVQPDIKKLVAYSSVSHMGLIVLGIFAFTLEGMEGALLQMLNHGLSTGALFLLVGMIYERRHTRMIADLGGLAHAAPFLSASFLVVTLSSIGLPGLNGFVGELLVLAGTFARNRTWAAIAATGMVLGAVYMLWMYQRVFWGRADRRDNATIPDLVLREKLILLPIVALMLSIGVYSPPYLNRMSATLKLVLERVESARPPEGSYRVSAPQGAPLEGAR